MFVSADVVLVTGKLAKIIGILRFNIEMLVLKWLCIIMLGELIWYFMISDRMMMIVMVMNDCVCLEIAPREILQDNKWSC